MADYFGADADDAIARYNTSTDTPERNRIFDEEIRPVFEKLISSLMAVYKYHRLGEPETMQRECLVHLYEMLPKFDSNRGTKGFSYFNVVAKNWFYNKSKEKKRREKVESDLHCDLDSEHVRSNPAVTSSTIEDDVEEKEFWVTFSSKLEQWKDQVVKEQDRKVLEAIIFLFRNSAIVTIYNKKAVYIYLRDLTGLTMKQTVNSLKRLRTLYYLPFKKEYVDGEIG
jgi:hypothetical protein